MKSQCPLAAQSGLILVLLAGWKSLHLLSAPRQTEGESSSGLKHLSTVYRDSASLFRCLTMDFRLGALLHTNVHSSPFSARITFTLWQVGVLAKHCAMWTLCCGFPMKKDRKRSLPPPSRSSEGKMSSPRTICNHVTFSTWQVALWDFCFRHFSCSVFAYEHCCVGGVGWGAQT